MSDRDNWKINIPRLSIFEIFSPTTGLAVTSYNLSNLVVALLWNGGTPGSPVPSVSISEIGNGRYLATYTPNALGYWYLSIRDPVNNPQGWVDELTVTQTRLDDLLTASSPLAVGVATAVLTLPLSTVEVAIRGVHCLGSIIQRIRNKVARTSPTNFAIYESDNSTVAWNATVSVDPSQAPVVSESPTT